MQPPDDMQHSQRFYTKAAMQLQLCTTLEE
jgi:hypothetical protein